MKKLENKPMLAMSSFLGNVGLAKIWTDNYPIIILKSFSTACTWLFLSKFAQTFLAQIHIGDHWSPIRPMTISSSLLIKLIEPIISRPNQAAKMAFQNAIEAECPSESDRKIKNWEYSMEAVGGQLGDADLASTNQLKIGWEVLPNQRYWH